MTTKPKSKRGGKVEIINYKHRKLGDGIVKCQECGKKGLLKNQHHMEREGVVHVMTKELTGSIFYLVEDVEKCDYINEKKAHYCKLLRDILE